MDDPSTIIARLRGLHTSPHSITPAIQREAAREIAALRLEIERLKGLICGAFIITKAPRKSKDERGYKRKTR